MTEPTSRKSNPDIFAVHEYAYRTEHPAAEDSPASARALEPEDAYLTGSSRSLRRRLLGLNIHGDCKPQTARREETPAGFCVTGSFAVSKK